MPMLIVLFWYSAAIGAIIFHAAFFAARPYAIDIAHKEICR